MSALRALRVSSEAFESCAGSLMYKKLKKLYTLIKKVFPR